MSRQRLTPSQLRCPTTDVCETTPIPELHFGKTEQPPPELPGLCGCQDLCEVPIDPDLRAPNHQRCDSLRLRAIPLYEHQRAESNEAFHVPSPVQLAPA